MQIIITTPHRGVVTFVRVSSVNGTGEEMTTIGRLHTGQSGDLNLGKQRGHTLWEHSKMTNCSVS